MMNKQTGSVASRGARHVARLLALVVLVAAFIPGLLAGTALASATISSFSPQSGPVGTSVTINGHGFTGAKNVCFNGTCVGAGNFTVNSNVRITTAVPTGATTGKISVVASDDTTATSTDDFVVTANTQASITSFSPSCGPVGTSVTIQGVNFDGATAVKFNGTSATSFTVDSSLQITATVPTEATTGKITVTGADAVVATSATDFSVTGNFGPTISSFTPTSGPVGTSVAITGSNFCGASAVKFNGTDATDFSIDLNTQITATVPTGATTGKITVTTPIGTATSSTDFTVTNTLAPTITSFSPTFGVAGTVVTITGTKFTGATQVTIGTKADPSFTVVSDTKITATVQAGAHSGPVSVTTPNGTATSATQFTVGTAPVPQITSFSPTSGPTGTKVTITGTGFTGAMEVDFNGVPDPTFHVDSDTQITSTVPSTATTGPISVTGPGGTGTSATNFTVTSPSITSFSPMIGPWGTHVVVTGANFSGVTSVKFNGVTASFAINSSTQITATVPNGATTGPIAITTPVGTGTSSDPFTIKHLRTASLSLSGKLTAAGAVMVTDGTMACAAQVSVKIQKHVHHHWKTVRTATTSSIGAYSAHLRNRHGKYRARAPKLSLSDGDVCGRATSGIVFH